MALNKKIEVSVIISHYGSPDDLRVSLRYIEQWRKEYEMRNGENTTEIIVADSATNHSTKELMYNEFPEITFIESKKNIGFGRAVNKGLRRCLGEFIFVMNADLIVSQAKNLDNLLDYIKENKSVGIVAPKILNFDETLQHSAFRFYTPIIVLLRRISFLANTNFGRKRLERFDILGGVEDLNNPILVDWVMGSAFATTRENLSRVGIFDERFFMYMEDVDLCRRFRNHDLGVVYYPNSYMYHFHGGASRNRNFLFSIFNKYTITHFLSAIKYFSKHGVRG